MYKKANLSGIETLEQNKTRTVCLNTYLQKVNTET